jgi:hypothetical protein
MIEPHATSRIGPRTKRALQAGVSLVVVVAIFAFAIPRIADYSEVWSTITHLTPIELWSLVAATVFNLATYWLANMAALPGLSFGQAAVVTQTTTTVANTIPAGGAVAVGLTYTILRSWGFDGHAISLYVGVTGIWNVFLKLGLPIVALALLAATGQASAALVAASLVGLLVLAVALSLFALMLWKKELARSGVEPPEPSSLTGLTSRTSIPSWSATARRMASPRRPVTSRCAAFPRP